MAAAPGWLAPEPLSSILWKKKTSDCCARNSIISSKRKKKQYKLLFVFWPASLPVVAGSVSDVDVSADRRRQLSATPVVVGAISDVDVRCL